MNNRLILDFKIKHVCNCRLLWSQITNKQGLSEHFTHSGLLSQVSIHLLLAKRGHFLYLLVVALHSLLILWDLLGIQQLVGRGVLKNNNISVRTVLTTFSLAVWLCPFDDLEQI